MILIRSLTAAPKLECRVCADSGTDAFRKSRNGIGTHSYIPALYTVKLCVRRA
jgi:hypothetical protein